MPTQLRLGWFFPQRLASTLYWYRKYVCVVGDSVGLRRQ